VADPAWLTADSVIVPIQVNGKRRAELELPRGSSPATVEALALADVAVRRAMDGKPPRRVVVVPDKIVNVVV
jgi:leucyl-tRNA synthetase